MANRYRNLIYSTAEYTESYGGFKGVELNASSLVSSRSRLAFSKNMYKNYDTNGADVIESVPGFRCFAHYGQKVHAIYYQRSISEETDHLLVHVGSRLMRHPVSDIHSENSAGTLVTTLKDCESYGFEYGRYFYVMDTERIYRIDESGRALVVGDSGAVPYIPTTYISGEPHEQRNLLISGFKEEYYVADPRTYLFSSQGLKYDITNPYLRYCSVSGILDGFEGELYLPSFAELGGVTYKVTAVSDSAFENSTSITAVYIADGISEIGTSAFKNCTSLQLLALSPTVTKVNEHAFYGCSSLQTVYVSASVSSIGEDAFAGTSSNTLIHYALGPSELARIEGREEIQGKSSRYHSRYEAVKIALPLHDDVEGLTRVTVDGVAREFDSTDNGSYFTGVVLSFNSLSEATGVTVNVSGILAPLDNSWSRDMSPIANCTPYKAIASCRCAEVFDGRIFFSGNPSFPNTVFYTERPDLEDDGALYIGRYNYFNDGVGSYKVKSLLSVRDMLAVFKEGDDGSGSIFYHKKNSVDLGAIDTVYPVAYVHSGICATGQCFSFLDDPVFVSSEGIMALNSENISYQRSIACRSHNVNYALLKEELSNIHLCEWLGYLVVGVAGKIFLADSRSTFTHPSGCREYEWFMLDDIGAYSSDSRVFRLSPEGYKDTVPHPSLAGEKVDFKDVYSATDQSGQGYYYVIDGNVKYSVVPTEEMDGGIFSPATVFMSYGKLLFFATDDGHLCVFNNDMIGVAPESVKCSGDYDDQEYTATMGDRLHPLYYSFDGHAPEYVIKTALDDCGVPHLTKSSVKRSLVVKAKSYVPDSISCHVVSDGGDPVYVASFPTADISFGDFDFTHAPWYKSRYVSTALPEKEKRWIEKQITLSSSTFASPISIYSLSYRYVIKGKIKNNT